MHDCQFILFMQEAVINNCFASWWEETRPSWASCYMSELTRHPSSLVVGIRSTRRARSLKNTKSLMGEKKVIRGVKIVPVNYQTKQCMLMLCIIYVHCSTQLRNEGREKWQEYGFAKTKNLEELNSVGGNRKIWEHTRKKCLLFQGSGRVCIYTVPYCKKSKTKRKTPDDTKDIILSTTVNVYAASLRCASEKL